MAICIFKCAVSSSPVVGEVVVVVGMITRCYSQHSNIRIVRQFIDQIVLWADFMDANPAFVFAMLKQADLADEHMELPSCCGKVMHMSNTCQFTTYCSKCHGPIGRNCRIAECGAAEPGVCPTLLCISCCTKHGQWEPHAHIASDSSANMGSWRTRPWQSDSGSCRHSVGGG